mmetsp:Transcript_7008/g.13760  ORF Transcript_7008/g.13760 Transcript_7008/m.13760 type:complete len:81 (+) Transcript_7008:289-531(+)
MSGTRGGASCQCRPPCVCGWTLLDSLPTLFGVWKDGGRPPLDAAAAAADGVRGCGTGGACEWDGVSPPPLREVATLLPET